MKKLIASFFVLILSILSMSTMGCDASNKDVTGLYKLESIRVFWDGEMTREELAIEGDKKWYPERIMIQLNADGSSTCWEKGKSLPAEWSQNGDTITQIIGFGEYTETWVWVYSHKDKKIIYNQISEDGRERQEIVMKKYVENA